MNRQRYREDYLSSSYLQSGDIFGREIHPIVLFQQLVEGILDIRDHFFRLRIGRRQEIMSQQHLQGFRDD